MNHLLLIVSVFITLPPVAAKVDTLDVPSASMNRTLRAAVVLPTPYKKAKQPFPVLYLLHGGSGSFRDWLTKTPDKMLLHQLADQYNLIIVTPDGDPTSYYFDSPLVKTSQFETFISKELIDKIDNTYRTIRDRKGRIIAGLSMGGHGAMFIAARHPDLYAAAGSMSGVMDINTATCTAGCWPTIPRTSILSDPVLTPGSSGAMPRPIRCCFLASSWPTIR